MIGPMNPATFRQTERGRGAGAALVFQPWGIAGRRGAHYWRSREAIGVAARARCGGGGGGGGFGGLGGGGFGGLGGNMGQLIPFPSRMSPMN
jgi:hypothetical protein